MKDFWKFLVGMVLAFFFVTPDTEDKVVDNDPVPPPIVVPDIVPDVVPEPEPFVPPSQICQCSPDCTCGCEAGTGESCSCGNSQSSSGSEVFSDSSGCVTLPDGTVVCPPASGSNQPVMSSSGWGTQSTSGRVYRRRGIFGGFFRR